MTPLSRSLWIWNPLHVFVGYVFHYLVSSIHPECRFHLEIQEEETKCVELLSAQTEAHKACRGVWDNITCWHPADVGETVTVPCPAVFGNLHSKPGNISKNCTSDGWSEMFPDFIDACGYDDPEDEGKIMFYILVKAVYTLGYSVSLISLTTGSVILCLFRKLHCTRNYIHLNLFFSFILRAVSVLVKDDVLYSSSGTLHCPDQPSSWVRLSPTACHQGEGGLRSSSPSIPLVRPLPLMSSPTLHGDEVPEPPLHTSCRSWVDEDEGSGLRGRGTWPRGRDSEKARSRLVVDRQVGSKSQALPGPGGHRQSEC